MVILVVPMLSHKILNADSCYMFLKRLLPAILEKRPDWLFDVVWPSNSSDWVYYKDGLFEDERLRRSPSYIDSNKMRQVTSFEARNWEKLLDYRYNHYDVIFNNAAELGDLIKNFALAFHELASPYVVNFHHYVLHESLNYPVKKTYEHVLLRQLVAALNVDCNMVNSDHCKNMLMENAIDYLIPSQTARIRDTILKVPFGCLERERWKKTKQKRHEKFTFAYNHRLQGYKMWQTTFDIFKRLYEDLGDVFEVQIHKAIAADRLRTLAHYPFVKVVDTPDYDQYLRELSKCHANMIHSVHETFCISAVDSMAFGQPIIAPNGVTFPEITGKKTNGYPALFDTEDGSYQIARKMITDPAFHKKCGAMVKKWVWDNFTVEACAEVMVETFERFANQDVLSSLKRRAEWEKLVNSRSIWKIDDLRRAAYESTTEKGTIMAGAQSFPCIKIKRVANQLGFRDRWARGGLELIRD